MMTIFFFHFHHLNNLLNWILHTLCIANNAIYIPKNVTNCDVKDRANQHYGTISKCINIQHHKKFVHSMGFLVGVPCIAGKYVSLVGKKKIRGKTNVTVKSGLRYSENRDSCAIKTITTLSNTPRLSGWRAGK